VKKLNQVNRVATVIAIVAIGIVAIALGSPAVRAQDGVNAPMSVPSSVPAMGSGTVGDSIRAGHANDAAAPAAQPASSDDMSGDSISVTGGVPGGSTTSGASTSAPAAPAEASAPPVTAPPEASAPAAVAPAEASAPAPAAPSEASAPAPPPPAEASAPVSAQPAPPVTASEPAPAAVPSVAPAPEAAASLSTPVTTAAVPASGTLAPPMVMAPIPAEVAPEPAPSPAIAPAATEQAPPQFEQTAGKSGRGQTKDTKVASNEPQENNPTGLQFGNNKGPIHIKSESMSLDYQNHSVLWTGHVHAEQANAQLTSDQLRVNYFDKDFKQLKDMVADGNVRMSQGTQWATGQHGVMDQTKRTMVLTGSPVVHDCANQITGKRITVYLDTNRSVVEDARAVIFPHSGKGEDSAPTPGCQ
jgi:lipopolysaccharide transport protein LptA